jgi:hypothetical protein
MRAANETHETMSYEAETKSERVEALDERTETFQPFLHDHFDAKQIADTDVVTPENATLAEQILDLSGVDFLIDTYDAQYTVQAKRIKSGSGTDLMIPSECKKDTVAPQSERVQKSVFDPTMFTAGYYIYGRESEGNGFDWVRLVDAHALKTAWVSGAIQPTFWNGTGNDTDAWRFSPEQLDMIDAIVKEWHNE